MVRLVGRLICASDGELSLVKAHLPEHLRLSRNEAGCLSFTVEQAEDPMIWQVEEHFVDRAAFDAHQHRTQKSDWWQATASIAREYRLSEETTPPLGKQAEGDHS